jgi:predicted RNase H-like nuclease (RuvC/YqgF family)
VTQVATQADEELSAEVDALRRDLGEEHLKRVRLEERLAGIERVHAAELGARDTTVADLRTELARLRLPFWRRWIG